MRKLRYILYAFIAFVTIVVGVLTTFYIFNFPNKTVSTSFSNYIIENSYSECMEEMLEYINQPFSKVVDYYGDLYRIENNSDRNAMNFCLYNNRIVYDEKILPYKIDISSENSDDNLYSSGIIYRVTIDGNGREVLKGIHIGDSINKISNKTHCIFTDINTETFSYAVDFDSNISFHFEFYNGVLKDCYLTKNDYIAYNYYDDSDIKKSFEELTDICDFFNNHNDLRYDINKFYYSGIYYEDRTKCLCYEWTNDNFEFDGDKVSILIESINDRRAYIIFSSENDYSGLNLIWKNGQYVSPIDDYLGLWTNKEYKDYYYLYIKEIDGYNFKADYYYINGNGYSKIEITNGTFGSPGDFNYLKNSSYLYSASNMMILLINENTYTIEVLNTVVLDVKYELNDSITKNTIYTLENNVNSIQNVDDNIIEPNINSQGDYTYDEISDEQTIRDSSGKIIGTIYILNNGDKIVRSFSGRYLGKYQKDLDRTYDELGNIVFFGDNASGLLR